MINTKLVEKYAYESGLDIDSLFFLAIGRKEKPFTDENQLLNIAKSIHLEIEKYKYDTKNTDESNRRHSINRQNLYDAGVYSVPAFIVNGRIIDNFKTLEVYLSKTLN